MVFDKYESQSERSGYSALLILMQTKLFKGLQFLSQLSSCLYTGISEENENTVMHLQLAS